MWSMPLCSRLTGTGCARPLPAVSKSSIWRASLSLTSSSPPLMLVVENRENRSAYRLHGQLTDRLSSAVSPTTKFVSGPSPLKRQLLAGVGLDVVATSYFYVLFCSSKTKRKPHFCAHSIGLIVRKRLHFSFVQMQLGSIISANLPPACSAGVHCNPNGPILRSQSSCRHSEG